MNEKTLTLLSGQSGYKVELIQSSNMKSIVRKSSPDDMLERFKCQYEKHCEALEKRDLGISVPVIVRKLKKNSYDMEFVPSVSLSDFIALASLDEIELVIKDLRKYFETILLAKSEDCVSKQDLLVKIEKVEESLGVIKLSSPYTFLLRFLRDNLSSLLLPNGWNHGDLSFDNILVTDHEQKVWVVDFLDSPFDTPILDLARFWIDAKYGSLDSIRLDTPTSLQNRKLIAGSVQSLIKEKCIDETSINFLSVLYIVRMIPYTKSAARVAHLKNVSHELLRDLKR